MKKRILCLLMIASMLFSSACGKKDILSQNHAEGKDVNNNHTSQEENYSITEVDADTDITELEKGLSVTRFDGNDLFETFLSKGGASSDADVVSYLSGYLAEMNDVTFEKQAFGCSTVVTRSKNGFLYGRNFDWEKCDALIVESHPTGAYASISTVNLDFIKSGAGPLMSLLSDESLSLVALYAPLDGMNEKGLFISVNMIQDSANINQNTSKNDITTTTAVRMLLNKAATTDEAIALLEEYDMHASFGMMVHFAIADANGKSVVCEYINNELVVTETPVVTNFYLTEGDKYGIGTQQSHDRYDKLIDFYSASQTYEVVDVMQALDSVSKHNYNVPETTEWSIVFDSENREAFYFHREDYTKAYRMGLD